MSSLHPKAIGKSLLCRVLESHVKQLREHHEFMLIAVAGSVGKTSTKLAIAQTLERAGLRVRYQSGNYNDRLTVPLVIFGEEMPGLVDVLAWLRLLRRTKQAIHREYAYDIVVVELGTDGVGQMDRFAYLQPDVGVLTAIAPEHMEQFGALEAVAKEELTLLSYAKRTLLGTDDIPAQYVQAGETLQIYSIRDASADYFGSTEQASNDGQVLTMHHAQSEILSQPITFLGKQGAKVALAAAATAHMCGVKPMAIASALQALRPFAGRMQRLNGVKNTTIIDDTYNATPSAVRAGLEVLAGYDAPERIAVLGSMNELGEDSVASHQEIGALLDAERIHLLVTIGKTAEAHLAPAAKQRGISVVSFANPVTAGEYVRDHMKAGAVIFVKGSQNGVFSEEAIKPLLANPNDASKLVRQSADWIKRKQTVLQSPE